MELADKDVEKTKQNIVCSVFKNKEKKSGHNKDRNGRFKKTENKTYNVKIKN